MEETSRKGNDPFCKLIMRIAFVLAMRCNQIGIHLDLRCLILCLLFFYHCQYPIRKPHDRQLKKIVSVYFYLQPFQGSKISIDNKPIRFQKIRVDKTIGLLKIKAPLYRDGLGFSLTIVNKNFKTVTRKVFLQGQDENWPKQPPFFALDKKNSNHRFRHYWKTGKKPKSVTFIDQYRVAIPLLNDTGIDIIHILSGETKRIEPPSKYSRLGGFVESLVLKDEKEFWVSQMNSHSIHVFDLDQLSYIKTIPLSGKWVKALLYDNERHRVYASNWITKDISVIDVSQAKEIKKIDVGGIPRGLYLSEDHRYLYVALYGREHDTDRQGRLVKVDLSLDAVVKEMGEPGSKRHIVYVEEGGRLFLSDMKSNYIEIYDLGNDSFFKQIRVFDNPNTIVVEPDDKEYLYVSCRGPNGLFGYLEKGSAMGRIYVVDLSENKILEEWEAGNQPTGLDVSSNGHYIVFSDFLDHAIRVYERL